MERSRTLAGLAPRMHDRLNIDYLGVNLVVRFASRRCVTASACVGGDVFYVHLMDPGRPAPDGKSWWRDGWGIHYGDDGDGARG